jgi:hypothetical protein
VQQSVGVSKRRDIEQRLGAPLRTADARYVCEFHRCRDPLPRVEQSRELVEAIVRDSRHADVRVGFSTPRRGISNAGEELEKRGLSGGRESDEACTQHKKRSVYRGLHC